MRRGWHAVVAAPGPFTAVDYRDRVAGLGVAGGAVVSGSFQGFDQSYLVGALAALDPTLVGVTQLRPPTRGREHTAAPGRAWRQDQGHRIRAGDPQSGQRDPAIMAVNPSALMVGSDLPSTRARRPFRDEDFDLVRQVLDPAQVRAVFWDNAASLCLNA